MVITIYKIKVREMQLVGVVSAVVVVVVGVELVKEEEDEAIVVVRPLWMLTGIVMRMMWPHYKDHNIHIRAHTNHRVAQNNTNTKCHPTKIVHDEPNAVLHTMKNAIIQVRRYIYFVFDVYSMVFFLFWLKITQNCIKLFCTRI